MRSLRFLLACALLLPSVATAGQVLTQVTNWRLTFTHSGLAVAPNGNLYAADAAGAVDYFSPQGELLGSWPARSSALEYNGPQGIAIDRQGAVYVVYSNGLVQKFSASGVRLWEFTDSLCGQGRAITVDHSGNIYVGSFGAIGSTVEFNHAGRFIREYPSRQASGLAVDAAGNVYTAGRDFIEKFSPHGDLLARQEGAGACSRLDCFDLVADAQGFVIAANSMYSNLLFLSPELTCVSTWTMPALEGEVVQQTLPEHVAYDPAGYLYVHDTMYGLLVKYRLDTSTPTRPMTWGSVKALYR